MKRIRQILFIIISTILLSETILSDTFIYPVSKTEFIVHKGEDKEIKNMKGKEFILISLRERGADGRFYAFNSYGELWLSGVISSGAQGHRTPEGAYKVFWKKRYHMSSIYPDESGINNMDYSLFFTKDGIAIHQGNPNMMSHGCIHVSKLNADKLFEWADNGMEIIVTRDKFINIIRPELLKIY